MEKAIKSLGYHKEYKNLGVLQFDTVKNKEMKDMITNIYYKG